MVKRVILALLCATGAAHADTYTAPIISSVQQCQSPGNVTATVKLSLKVTVEGKVEDVRVVESSGNETADRRAVECISGWTYKPATLNGVPVEKVIVFTQHWNGNNIDDLSGATRAFAKFERDLDSRCFRLYPVDQRHLAADHLFTLVNVVRLPSGEVQTEVTQSAGEKADKQAVACVRDLIKSHDDLPATFVRLFQVRWTNSR